MADALALITEAINEYPSVGASGERLGGGAFGRVTEFTLRSGIPGSKLVWLREEYTRSSLGLVAKRGRQTVAKYGYGNIHELEVSRHLQHPNLVEIVAMQLPAPESGEQLALIMPRAQGTVMDLILSDDTDHIRRVLGEILTGLEYVHDSGFIHRDLKPANVLLYDGHARLADFGSSVRVTGRPLDRMMTTYVYCSPEQVGCRYTQAVDLWSFGCMLFEIICQGVHLVNVDVGSPARSLLTAIINCPSIEINDSEMIEMSFRDKTVIDLLWRRKPTISWSHHIASLGHLERAIAITGSVDNLERILGGLLCTHPDRRLDIKDLRLMPLFREMKPPTLVQPRLVWTQKTSDQYLKPLLPSIGRIMAKLHRDEPPNLCYLFTANCLYSTCVSSLSGELAENSPLFTRLYVACIMVASAVHDIDYKRSSLIGKIAAREEAQLSNILETFVLITCCGLMDQETIYDRSRNLGFTREILNLYTEDFTSEKGGACEAHDALCERAITD